MPKESGNYLTIYVFVYARHGKDKVDRRSQTGIFIFMNKYPIHWYSKRQRSVETSTFGDKFYAMKVGVEMVKALRYKLRIFGIPLDVAATTFFDNEAVYKDTDMPKSKLRKKRQSIAYHRFREAVIAKVIKI